MDENILQAKKSKLGLNGGILKIIAILTMLIDHTGAILIENGILKPYMSGNILTLANDPVMKKWLIIDGVLRLIGRIAFPIFCFLLVEGFLHTRDVKKYALRLASFALISEIPFDFAFMGKLTFGYQNVFFTLLIGLLVMIGLKHFEGKRPFDVIMRIVTVIAGIILAQVMKTDYAGIGVLLIVILYVFREKRVLQCVIGGISFIWELTSAVSFVLIAFYNGEKGKVRWKYFFYIFYPAHILILYLISRILFK